MTPTPRRRRGRPTVEPGQKSTPVNVVMSERLYAAVSAAARTARCTVPEYIRQRLETRKKVF